MSSIRQSVAWSFFSRYSTMAINFVVVIVVARLLSPEEVGIFSVSAALVFLAQAFREFGLSNYLVQEKDLTDVKIRTVFGVAILISWLMGLILFMSADLIADLYAHEAMRNIIFILAINFFIVPFALPAQALLRRHMYYSTITKIQVFNSLISAATTLLLVWWGASYLSMAWGAVAGMLGTIGLMTLLKTPYLFLIPSLREWRSITRFGFYASLTSLATEVGAAAPDIIIGRSLGFSAVAYYSRSDGLLKIFRDGIQGAILPVAMSAFAKHHREKNNLKQDYLRSVQLMTVLAWPFYGMLFLLASLIVPALYGAQWNQSIILVQIMCIAGILSSLVSLSGSLLIAMGEIKAAAFRETIIQVCRITFMIPAALHSLEFVAVAYVLTCGVAVISTQYLLKNKLSLHFFEVVTHSIQSGKVAIVSAAVPWLIIKLIDFDSDAIWLPLFTGVVVGAIIWIASIFIFNHPITKELKIFLKNCLSLSQRFLYNVTNRMC